MPLDHIRQCNNGEEKKQNVHAGQLSSLLFLRVSSRLEPSKNREPGNNIETF